MSYTQDDYKGAVDLINARSKDFRPDVGLVLGSGLGSLADALEDRVVIPYEEIPGWPQATVHGHGGELVMGRLEGQRVICQRGRAHFYEGYTMQQVTFPIRVMHYLGVSSLILTNAAGGLNTAYRAGDIMLINDHINWIGMSGMNPLMGPNDDSIGPRFLSMSHTYDADLRRIARRVAHDNQLILHEGVYVCVSGPAFETPAEIRMLRMCGGDAVGMSTAHEVLVARHAGMRVMACSGVTNQAIDHLESEQDTSHEEVLEAGAVIVPHLTTILRGVLREM